MKLIPAKLKNLLLHANEMYYRKLRVWMPFKPRKGICEACGERKRTNRHHWRYAYPTILVKENPILAMDYTNELCASPNPKSCHKLGDSLRNICEVWTKKPQVIESLLDMVEEHLKIKITIKEGKK